MTTSLGQLPGQPRLHRQTLSQHLPKLCVVGLAWVNLGRLLGKDGIWFIIKGRASGTLTDEKSNLESATSWGVRHYGNRALFSVLSGPWG